MAKSDHLRLLRVESASRSTGLVSINTPPDIILSTRWLRADPATERLVVLVQRGGEYGPVETVVLVTERFTPCPHCDGSGHIVLPPAAPRSGEADG